MNDKIWQWIGDYCSGLMDKSEEQELRAWMDEAEENKLFFMEGVKMVREYQVVTRSDKNASDSLKHVREKIKARGRRQLWIHYCRGFCCDFVRFIICIFLHAGTGERISRVG